MSDDAARAPFELAHRDGWRIEHHRSLSPDEVLAAIAEHRAHDARGREACEQWGAVSSLSRVRLASPRTDLAVKLCRYRGWRGALSDLARGSRARRALRGARRLLAARIPTAEPLALAERCRCGVPVESFVIARFIGSALPLAAAAPALRARVRERRALIRRLAQLVAALHAAGVDHRDLKHSNFLVADADAAGACAARDVGPRIWLVDGEGADPVRRPVWRRRVRALGQLEAFARDLYPWLPARDRAAFLGAYLEAARDLAPRRAALAREVERWVLRRLAAWSRRDRRAHHAYPLAPREAGTRDARFSRSRSDAAR
jgi:heptose I phosphotransferase